MERVISVAAVIPVHNRREITLQCLSSLARLQLVGFELKVYIVDDGSTDGTREGIEKYFPETVLVIGDGSLWYTGGINAGIDRALQDRPDFLLLMNDDQVFDSMCLARMLETARAYPGSIVGALLLLWDTPHRIFQVSPEWRVSWGGWRHWQNQTVWSVPNSPWEVDLIVGNCMLVPTEAVRKHGAMDGEMFPNFGDAEFTPRMKKRGHRLILDPRARVFCQPNTPPPKVSRMGLRELYTHLWADLRRTQNVRRRWRGYIRVAPNRFQGVIAFFVFYLRYLAGWNLEGDYGAKAVEPDLLYSIPKSRILGLK